MQCLVLTYHRVRRRNVRSSGSLVQGIARALAAALLVAVIGACTASVPSDAAVEKLGIEFFTALKSKDFERALDYYAPEFFEGRPREPWKARLQAIQEKLGDLQSFELKRKQVDMRYSGTFFIYEYSVVYANEKSWETVTFFIHVSGEQAIKVFGHQIKAKGI